ncbi:hypothetical protein GCM10022259_08160 [Aquimarina mytili]
MESTQKIFEQIEDYLAGKLEGNELESFKKLLEIDPELREEVRLHKELGRALKDKKALDFRKKLIKLEDKIDKKKESPIQKPFISHYWKIAASIAIIIGLFTFFWQIDQKEDLYATYYIPYPVENAKRGEVTHEEFKTIAQKYKEEEYSDIIPDLEQLITHRPYDEQLKLFLGNCYLNTGKTNKAIEQFLNINPQNRYYEDGLWYTILAHLKLEQNKEAILLLKKLIAYDGVHQENAIMLLEDLE